MSTVEETPVVPEEHAPPKLHLSASAIAEVRGMLEEEELLEEGGLRITTRFGAGCSTPLQFGLVLEEWPEEDDIVLEGNGIRLFLDPRSAWTLDGLVIDYVDAPGMGAGFTFRHPRGAPGRTLLSSVAAPAEAPPQ